MRLVRLIAVVMITAAQAGCAGLAPPWLAAPAPEAAVPADLDSILYGRGVPAVPVTPVVPAALPVPAGPPVVPVLPPPVPVAVLPGPAPGGDLPYTLDSGDRLRIVVFGQDGLSNTYLIDVSGKITMPLIGAVSARGCTTGSLRAPSLPGCATGTCASRMSQSRSRPIGRSSFLARCWRPACIRTFPT